MSTKLPPLTFYTIRLKKAGTDLYFKSRFDEWVENLEDAKVYRKPGPARSTITFFVRKKKYDPSLLELIELQVTNVAVIDDSSRRLMVDVKARIEREKQKRREAENDLLSAREDMQHAEAELESAERRARKIGVKV